MRLSSPPAGDRAAFFPSRSISGDVWENVQGCAGVDPVALSRHTASLLPAKRRDRPCMQWCCCGQEAASSPRKQALGPPASTDPPPLPATPCKGKTSFYIGLISQKTSHGPASSLLSEKTRRKSRLVTQIQYSLHVGRLLCGFTLTLYFNAKTSKALRSLFFGAF